MATGSAHGGDDSAHHSESIPALVASVRFAFRQVDFDALEAVLLAREQKFKHELEEKENEIDVLQLVRLEKIKLEEDHKETKKECAELREDLQFSNEQVRKYEQEVIMLKSRIIELDLQKSTDCEIGIWEKRYKELEGRVSVIMEGVAKLSGVDARMDCEVTVKREVGVGDSCLQKLVNEDGLGVLGAEDVRKMCDRGGSDVERGADTCGDGEKIISKANGDNENGMAAISGNEERTLPQIIPIVDRDGNENIALKRKQPASVNGDGNGDGGSQDNDQDFDDKSLSGRGTMMKCQKLTRGTNAGGKDSTPSKLDTVNSTKHEEPMGPLFKSPIPAGKFNFDGLYNADGSSSSSSSDSEDPDLQFEVPTCFIPNVEKAGASRRGSF